MLTRSRVLARHLPVECRGIARGSTLPRVRIRLLAKINLLRITFRSVPLGAAPSDNATRGVNPRV